MTNELELVQNNGTKESDPLAQARALIQQEQQERKEKCFAGIQSLLDEHQCQLVIKLQVGEAQVNLNQIVTLPGVVAVEVK